MPNWESYHGWMKFESLDVNDGLTCSFTIGYKFTDDDGDDEWSDRFSWFKEGDPAAIYGAENMMKTAVPVLVRALGITPSATVFVPALASDETVAHKKGGLTRIARTCAEVAQADFMRVALCKNQHRPLHKSKSAQKRREILDAAEYRSKKFESANNVLVFDDFITRGETLSHIARAIHAANPQVSVYGIALGKTDRRSYNKSASNDHVPEKWDTLWKAGEEEEE